MNVWRGWGILVVVLLVAGIGLWTFGPSRAVDAAQPPSPQPTAEAARPAPITALPQQVRASLAEASGDLSGRWNGTPGADGVREVVVIESQNADGFAGRAFFEDSSGAAVGGGQGSVSGGLIDGQVTFTITRDNRELVWTGWKTDAGRTLTGRFDGNSNEATYRRE